MTKEEPSRYLTNAEFLKLTPKERVDYLKRVTDEIFYRAQHAGQAKKNPSNSPLYSSAEACGLLQTYRKERLWQTI